MSTTSSFVPIPYPNYPLATPIPNPIDLKGKRVLITGASRGQGKALAEFFTAKGLKVIGTSRYPDKYPKPKGYKLKKLDTGDQKSVDALAKYVKNKWGGIDILINNAGSILYSTIATGNFDEYQNIMNVNCFGYLRMVRAFLPLMPKEGYARIGNTVSVSSIVRSDRYYSAYTVSKVAIKHAMSALVEELAADKKYSHVRIHNVHPAGVATCLIPCSNKPENKKKVKAFAASYHEVLQTSPPPSPVVETYHQILSQNDQPIDVTVIPEPFVPAIAGLYQRNFVNTREQVVSNPIWNSIFGKPKNKLPSCVSCNEKECDCKLKTN